MIASDVRSAAGVAVLAYGVSNLIFADAAPSSWVVGALAVWLTFLLCAGRRNVQQAWASILWGLASTLAFVTLLQTDRNFKGWADIYYFCSSAGKPLVYCTCDLSWSWSGYRKFLILWNFVLSAALGVQKLVVTFLLDGLLPGEEMVTKESFFLICWRLIPYWLNNWENDWGAECLSALFELPIFAVELLVVLPTVQILCSRLRILVLPQLRVVVPEGVNDVGDLPQEQLAPNIMRGFWHLDKRQTSVWGRLRANKRVMLLMVGVAFLAAANAVLVPAALEAAVLAHPRSIALASMPLGAGPLDQRLHNMESAFLHRSCTSRHAIRRGMQKHASELHKMASPEHIVNLPLIEVALSIMRLSCEKFFVLASVFCAFLIFREPPLWVRHVISTVARLSDTFQTSILMTFPAFCWYYNAGIIFSTFATVVLWTGPLVRLLEKVRLNIAHVRPASLTAATAAEIDRMDGKCAICWSEFPLPEPSEGGVWAPYSLPCSHAFHRPCIVQWLRQCHSQGRNATCPMCSATVELTVRWHLPWHNHGVDPTLDMPIGGAEGPEAEVQLGNGAPQPAAAAATGWFPEIQTIIENMDDFGAAHLAAGFGGGGEQAPHVPQQPHAAAADGVAVVEHEQRLHHPQEPHHQQQQQQQQQPGQARWWAGVRARNPPQAAAESATCQGQPASSASAAASGDSANWHTPEELPAQRAHSPVSSLTSSSTSCATSRFSTRSQDICGSRTPAYGPRVCDDATSADRRQLAGPSGAQQQWQRQLSSGISFGTGVPPGSRCLSRHSNGSAAAASATPSQLPAASHLPDSRAQLQSGPPQSVCRSRSPHPEAVATDSESITAALECSNSYSNRSTDPVAAGDECTAASGGLRRSIRQRFAARWSRSPSEGPPQRSDC